MINILITGGCGFIGINLINHLLKSYDNIFILNIDKLNYHPNINLINSTDYQHRYKFIPISILENDSIYSLLSEYNINYVIHCASAYYIDNSFNNSINFSIDNYIGTHYLLEAIQKYGKLSRFIHLSNIELTNHDNLNPYSATKLATEILIKSYNIPYLIIRLPVVFGKFQYNQKIIPSFINRLLHNEKLIIYGNGNNYIHLVYIQDIINAISICLFNDITGIISIYSSQSKYSIYDIACMIIKIIKGNDADFNDWITFINDDKNLINNLDNLNDSDDLYKIENLGFIINSNDLTQNITTTIDYYTSII
jgi:dTDP-D-glucose 4,6-dehydratase